MTNGYILNISPIDTCKNKSKTTVTMCDDVNISRGVAKNSRKRSRNKVHKTKVGQNITMDYKTAKDFLKPTKNAKQDYDSTWFMYSGKIEANPLKISEVDPHIFFST